MSYLRFRNIRQVFHAGLLPTFAYTIWQQTYWNWTLRSVH